MPWDSNIIIKHPDFVDEVQTFSAFSLNYKVSLLKSPYFVFILKIISDYLKKRKSNIPEYEYYDYVDKLEKLPVQHVLINRGSVYHKNSSWTC